MKPDKLGDNGAAKGPSFLECDATLLGRKKKKKERKETWPLL
jgi:hypothetical protein